jgi:hypothetical protein
MFVSPRWVLYSEKASVQAPNSNSSSKNDMFTVVGTIFQQIMTEINGAESEADRIVAITKKLYVY